MIKAIVALIVLLSTVSMASAFTEFDVNPDTQEILVGTTGIYTLTLNTSDAGKAGFLWKSDDPDVKARINGEGDFKKNGLFAFENTPNAEQTFTLEVQPQDGVTLNKPVDVDIGYIGKQGGRIRVRATTTAGVVPIPELGTVVLTSAGLIGLFALARKKE